MYLYATDRAVTVNTVVSVVKKLVSTNEYGNRRNKYTGLIKAIGNTITTKIMSAWCRRVSCHESLKVTC